MIRTLLEEARWQELAGCLSGRLDLPLAPAWVEQVARRRGLALYATRRRVGPDYWSCLPTEADLLNWWKLRAEEARLDARTPPEGSDDATAGFRVRLHVGFLCLVESEAMLARLRSSDDRTGRRQSGSAEARSKLTTTNLATVRPIDRVARRVVRWEEES